MYKEIYKTITAFALALLFSVNAVPAFSIETIGTSAEAAILINADDGSVLYEKDADKKLPMASTTKIMTAIVAIENGNLSKEIRINEKAVGVEGSSVYLTANDRCCLSDLLYALLLESANDAAAAIAFEIGGSIETFSDMMNEKAKELGLNNTHFTNPHGLDDDNHYTTARDLAALTSYALKNETFKKIVSTFKKTIDLKDRSVELVNHNRLLVSYDGCIGVKTGYTKRCGRCLVTSAERNGLRLISVTLNDPNDWKDHTSLLDYGYSTYHTVKICGTEGLTFSVPTSGGNKDSIVAGCDGEIVLSLPNKKGSLRTTLEIRRFLIAPIKKGDFIGFVVIKSDGKEVCRKDLYALEDCPERRYNISLMEKLFG